ncbi:MAG: hypothetical protein LBF08_04580 [Dysgonamonadaceae bacterium]|jgi:hypothetical protein|nr:hypothetical protein [Dysgonamonadaceae bacterium]
MENRIRWHWGEITCVVWLARYLRHPALRYARNDGLFYRRTVAKQKPYTSLRTAQQ